MDNTSDVDGYCPKCKSYLYAQEGWKIEGGKALIWCGSRCGFVAPLKKDPSARDKNTGRTRRQSEWPMTHAGEGDAWKYMNQVSICKQKGVPIVEHPDGVTCPACRAALRVPGPGEKGQES